MDSDQSNYAINYEGCYYIQYSLTFRVFNRLIFESLFLILFLCRGEIRNMGKPVALCKQYYDAGADEVVFLNITSFRQGQQNNI